MTDTTKRDNSINISTAILSQLSKFNQTPEQLSTEIGIETEELSTPLLHLLRRGEIVSKGVVREGKSVQFLYGIR